MSIWEKKFKIRWSFINELCGNFPLDENIYKDWYEKHWTGKVKAPQGKTIQEMQEEVFDAVLEAGVALATEDQKGVVGFLKRDNNLVVGGYTVRSHIKECARVLSSYYIGKVKGEKAFSSKIINCTYVEDVWIPILRDFESGPLTEPDGIIEKPLTAIIPQTGQKITTIKRFLYASPAAIEFTLLAFNIIKKEDIEKCLEYGSLHGYLGERAVGKGRYIFTVKEVNGDEERGKENVRKSKK